MSIEYLPLTPTYPKNRYHVRPNAHSMCHPETCTCRAWKVVDPDGKIVYTTDDLESAEDTVARFNSLIGVPNV